MKILVVDDERLARERLVALVKELGMGEEVVEAANGKEALNIAQALQPEVVLLDIRMPGIDGMETARRLNSFHPKPVIIFTTAYDEHALSAFEQQALDYLLKPIQKERLEHALKRAYQLLKAATISTPITTVARTHIRVHFRGELFAIPVNQIYYFSADEKYVMLCWTQGKILVAETIKDLEKEFSGQFLRIHRSRLISIEKISRLFKNKTTGRNYVCLRDLNEQLEVSRRHLPTLRKILKDMRISTD